MTGFRVDKRVFGVGGAIPYSGTYQQGLTDKQRVVEEVLESTRPNGKPKRDEHLFVFKDSPPARKFWSKLTNGKLYKVEFPNASILHSGDMTLTEQMFHSIGNQRILEDLACRYWAGLQTVRPEIELLVDNAIVIEIISTSQAERRIELIKRWGLLQF